MYAYKSNVNYDYNYDYSATLNERRFVNRPVHRKRVIYRKKKKTPVTSIIALFAFLGLFLACVVPFSYQATRNLFGLNNTPSMTTEENQLILNNSKLCVGANLQDVLFPTLSYINNDMFFNKSLLAGSVSSKKNISEMYVSEELTGLETQLKDLNKLYPSIKPSIYVWSFESGKFAQIDADKVYPAASIIKIPVLVQLFKSIEANQVTIYDEMQLTYPFRASGSGDIQYAQDGRMYTLDDLAKVMIQNSDNSATNMLMSKMGGIDDVNTAIRSWGLKNTHIQTWLPDLTGTNKTTAKDLAKILYNLENPSFLNLNSREDIIKYMSKVKNNRLIQAGLPSGIPFVHKTGDIGTMLGDAGIVYMPSDQHYIVVIMATRPHNSHDGVEFIQKASSIIYSYMSKLPVNG